MLLNLKKQWNERSFRKSIYLSPKSVQAQTINFAEYERSSARTEMPSKHKKIPVSKIDVETIFSKRTADPLGSGLVSPPLSHKASISSVREPTQRQFYYVEDNEIMSIDGFFDVYQGMLAHQKVQQKVVFKKELLKKRKKIEEIHVATAQPLARSTSMSTADLLIFSKNASDVNSPVNKPVQTDLSQLFRTKSFHHSKFAPSAAPPGSPSNANAYTSSRDDQAPSSPAHSKKPQRKFVKGLSVDYSFQKGMTTDQKFTEKEIDKHLMCLTVSPKFMKNNVTPSQKEKSYSVMFKDPKTMDTAVENSIRKAHRMTLRKICGASESYRAPCTPDEPLSCASNRRVDPVISRDDPVEEEFVTGVSSKDELGKKETIIGRKIQDNIKRIDKILRASSLEQSPGPSPKNSARPPSKHIVRVKNKYPLRSTVAQKYNLKDKVTDQRTMAAKIKKVSDTFKKEVKGSSVKSQAYLSYYH